MNLIFAVCALLLACQPGGALAAVGQAVFQAEAARPLLHARKPADLSAEIAPDESRWPAEVVAGKIEQTLGRLGEAIVRFPSAGRLSGEEFLAKEFRATRLQAAAPESKPVGRGLQSYSSNPAADRVVGYQEFEGELRNWLKNYSSIRVADLRLTQIKVAADRAEAMVRCELAGLAGGGGPRQDLAWWKTEWQRESADWRMVKLDCVSFSRAQAPAFFFQDVTTAALGGNASFARQLNRGIPDWIRRMDAASGIDFYGLNGLAAGDYDGDGWEDLLICQPGGLPNRLFRNRGDGTFQDVTAEANLAVLDSTASALWGDYDNDGDADLFLMSNDILLFENDGKGRFTRSPLAFEIAGDDRGTLMSAALADYDRDGFLDLYVCQYTPAGGSVMGGYLHQPTPYHDANSGAPNQLFRNNAGKSFTNVTAQAGLSVNNRRWSFAAAWGDTDLDGYPDLYVANDFGRNNLYRNNRNGTFTDVAGRAGVEDIAAGMSAAWEDVDNDGRLDLYVSNIWSASGQRLTAQDDFQPNAPKEVRQLYGRFTRGNSLYLARGDGTFEDATVAFGVENGGWAWASDFFDFDRDGWEDLYIVNGYITGDRSLDLESFQWRDVAGNSPLDATRSRNYQEGWRRLDRMMQESGLSTHGAERKRFYVNAGGTSFVDASAVSGLDFADDGRAFAILDFDNDGDLDLVTKNRTAPQARVLRNDAVTSHHGVAFELVGRTSNRDAIGARITLQAGELRRSKAVESASGFLSQHTRRVYFGLAGRRAIDSVRINWPSGAVEDFKDVPIDKIVRIEEGTNRWTARPFQSAQTVPPAAPAIVLDRTTPDAGTWLIERVQMPELKVLDPSGVLRSLSSQRQGGPVLVNFWGGNCEPCSAEAEHWSELATGTSAPAILSVSVDGSALKLRSVAQPNSRLKTYVATPEALELINIIVKHLFVRRSDTSLPLTLLVDQQGYIVKVYRESIDAAQIREDLRQLPGWPQKRVQLALPFDGKYYGPRRDRRQEYFWIGYDCLQAGFYGEALQYFQECLKLDSRFGKALNNVGAIYLRTGRFDEALKTLGRAAALEPAAPEIQFNIGTALAMKGQPAEAIAVLEKAAKMDPGDAEIWNNLGNAYLNSGRLDQAAAPLQRALQLNPKLAMAHNNLGIISGERGRLDLAEQHFREAVKLDPKLHHGYLNLGIIYLNTGRSGQALEMFRKVLQLDPNNVEAKRFLDQVQKR